MQVSVESTGALERRMRVDVPENRIEDEVKKRLQSLTKTIKIDGFRQGKVPLKVIQQRHGQQVRFEVLGEVMRDTYVEALGAEKLRPAGEPSIEQDEGSNSDKGLSYTATFEIYPEVMLNPVSDIVVDLPTCKVVDADVDKMVETLQTQQATFKETDRKAVMGDQLNLDFEGFLNNEKFDGGEAKGFDIELGSKRFIEGFEDGLVGLKAGENKSLDLKFPTPYQNKELEGKAVRFDVVINTVSEQELPELNDEFFKRFGVEEGGLDALKKNIRENMERECEQRVKNQAKSRVLDALYNGNPFNLPQSLINGETEQLMESAKQRLTQQGMPPEQLDSLDKDTFVDEAKKRVALGLLISEIIKTNEMTADPAKVRTMVESIGANYEDPAAFVQFYYADQSRLAEMQSMVLEEEVVSWIMDQAKVTPEPITFDVLMNPESAEE